MNTTRNGEFIPLGRLNEIRERPNASLVAYTVQGFDAKLHKFNSRTALEAFCKSGSKMHAVIKTPVSSTMLINRNVQRVA